jgi:glycosyltransferase involved in cell wall biosynthesis
VFRLQPGYHPRHFRAHVEVGSDDIDAPPSAGSRAGTPTGSAVRVPLVIATILREQGITGVHTHVRQLIGHLERHESLPSLVTPFSWGGPLIAPVFGVRFLLERFSGTANMWWYRHWHERFLQRALTRVLAEIDECVVYAQCPVAARAAMRARRGPHQRVVLAVHFRISQSDEWVDKGQIRRDGPMYRSVRALERDVISRVDGVLFVSAWGRDALYAWFPEAAAVPSAVITNFVAPITATPPPEPVGDLVTVGNLEGIKNHAYLFRVLAEARRAGRTYTLDVFGEGPRRAELEALIRSLGLEGQVRMRGFRTDVREFLPGYRAYVHASQSESLPLAVIEAMAAGLPVLAGRTGGIPELFDDGVEGRLWPLDDSSTAAALLVGLLDDEPNRSKAGVAARERFRRGFDAELVAPRLLAFIRGDAEAAAGVAVPDDSRHLARD